MTAIKPIENFVKNLPLILFNRKNVIPKQIIPITYMTMSASLTVESDPAISITPPRGLYRISNDYPMMSW